MKKTNKPETPGNAASRRRLIRAAGGGVAMATILGGWKKPVIESVVLPAHALTSGASTPPVSLTCSIAMQWSFDATVVGVGTLNFEAIWTLSGTGGASVSSITGAQTGVSNATLNTTVSTTLVPPAGSYTLFQEGVAVAGVTGINPTGTVAFSADCCTAAVATSRTQSGGGSISVQSAYETVITDDGQCSLAEL